MREQSSEPPPPGGAEQSVLARTAVVRFVMLQPEVRHVFRERQQEMIVAIVARAEKLARLRHQVLHVLLDFRAHRERRFAIRHDVHLMMDRLAFRRDVHGAEVFARHHRRVHQPVQFHGLERHFVS